ncbi:MAG: hypothetical protein ACOC1F_02590 [Myxococcota bacterium]
MVSLSLLPATTARAKVVTLQHDVLTDDAEAAAVCGFAIGEKLAASFTPPAYPARLLRVRILLTNVGLSSSAPCPSVAAASDISMPLEVFHLTGAAPGTSLGAFDEFAFSNENVQNEIDVSASSFTIDDGAFFVAYTIAQSNASPVHDNSQAAHNDENYIYADLGLGWKWYTFADLASYGLNPKGDWVIRLDVDVPDDPPDGGAGGAAGSGGTGGGGTGGAATGGAAGAAASGGAGGTGGATAGTGGAAGAAASSGSGGGASAECARDVDCEGGQVCDTDLGRCVQVSCTIDSECDGGYVCRDNACRKICTEISDCRGGEQCVPSGGVDICMPAAAAPSDDGGDDGGCSVGSRSASSGMGLGALVALLLAWRTRRPRN